MNCPNGHAISPGAAYCSACGAAVTSAFTPAVAGPAAPSPNAYAAPQPSYLPAPQPGYSPVATATASASTRGLYTAAAAINWVFLGLIVVATLGIGLICAFWFVPMTIQMHRGAKGPYKHTALGVCTLLFCNIISGILILVDDGNRPAKPAF